jgi:MFS family permease
LRVPLGLPTPQVFRYLTADGWLLFAARSLRMFAYGFLSVVLVLYLSAIGLHEDEIGLLLTLTLLGDTVISLWITTSADRIGRRRMLILGAVLMIAGGATFALTNVFGILVVAAIIGVISPSGNEVGPFLAIEQAALSQTVTDDERTDVFAWYNLIGSLSTALGALVSGSLCQFLVNAGTSGPAVYRPVMIAYAGAGVILTLGFARLSSAADAPRIEGEQTKVRWLGLHTSRPVVFKLAGLFALDSFAGGFVIQSFMAYWFTIRFGVSPAVLGAIFFAANLLAAVSALAAASLARRFGLLNTMVFTHLPSNVLLILVPLMPTLPLAIAVLLLRFSISQMDVPTRQSFTMAVVHADERSAASGITAVSRSIGASLSPVLVGAMFTSQAWLSAPFFLAGGLKIVYDLLLLRMFKSASTGNSVA